MFGIQTTLHQIPQDGYFYFCGRKNIKSYDHKLVIEEDNDDNLLLIIQTLR